MTRLDRITTDPAICHGQPRSEGRYMVESVLELFAAGTTINEFLADYPDRDQPCQRCERPRPRLAGEPRRAS